MTTPRWRAKAPTGDDMVKLWARDLRHGASPKSILLAIKAWVAVTTQ